MGLYALFNRKNSVNCKTMDVGEFSQASEDFESRLAWEATQALSPDNDDSQKSQKDPVLAIGRSAYAATAIMDHILKLVSEALIERDVAEFVPQKATNDTLDLLTLGANLLSLQFPCQHENDDEAVTEPVEHVY